MKCSIVWCFTLSKSTIIFKVLKWWTLEWKQKLLWGLNFRTGFRPCSPRIVPKVMRTSWPSHFYWLTESCQNNCVSFCWLCETWCVPCYVSLKYGLDSTLRDTCIREHGFWSYPDMDLNPGLTICYQHNVG